MKLSLGFSPCPNDTFIFDAMIHQKVDTEGLEFEVVMGDVEELNRLAFAGRLDITKLSYHAFAHLLGTYQLLDSGSALGNNCGPLLIAKRALPEREINNAKIAIPGKMTTANFLCSLAYPLAQNKVETLFSDIESAVLNEEVDAGLIIHENRFTYHERGLVKLMDCGEFWETKMNLPIPLGGIVVKSSMEKELQQKVDRVLRRSVEFAFANPDSSATFVESHAQEMDKAVMKKHIELYVNQYSISLGEKGKLAVEKLIEQARSKKIISDLTSEIFV